MDPAPVPAHMHEHRSPYLHLWVDTQVRLMYTEWLASPSAPEYREAAALFLRQLQEHEVEYWFMDSNRLGGLPLEGQREIIRQLAPAVAASRLRKVARIISQDEGNRAMFGEEVRELRNRFRASVEVRQFRTYGEAANWIAAIRA